MALTDYRPDAMRCTRCSYCKWIPFDLVQSHRFAKGCPCVEAGPVPRLLGRRQARHRPQPDGRAQRGHRPGRRRRLPLPALRELRRRLQAVPLRHGADPRAARAARPPRRRWTACPSPTAPLIERTRAALAARAQDPGRPQRLGGGAGPQGPGGGARRRRLLRRLQVLAWRRACGGRCARRCACSRRPASPWACFENGCCGGLADKMGYRDEAAEAGQTDARGSGPPPA